MEVLQKAEEALSQFLSKHNAQLSDLTNRPIEETDLWQDFSREPFSMTHFDDIYDTLLYSRLITKAIESSSTCSTVIDFGAGSSVPTLLALKRAVDRNLEAIAVDIDSAALETSRKNAEALGLSHRYQFLQGPMQTVIKSGGFFKRGAAVIASNPPYIPAPQDTNDYHLLPINGGDDGSKYIVEFLEQDYPPETTLALFWGSLCNPAKVIPMIEEKFEVLHVQAVRIHFGNYTTIPAINEHLYKLRDEGKVVFENSAEDGETQLVIGTILRPKA